MDDANIDWAIQAPITRVPTANGVSPLALEEIIQMRLFQHRGDPWGWYYPLDHMDSRVPDVMNVRYVLTGPANAPRAETLAHNHAPLRHVESLALGVEVFENPDVLPRFFLTHEAKPARSLADARRLLAESDLSRTVITDRWIELPPSVGSGAESVEVVRYEPSTIELRVKAQSVAAMVASESFYPGWKAWVNGRESEIFRADIGLRGVVVPAGESTVRMEFHPPIFPLSIAVSAAAILALAALSFRGAYRGSGRETPPPAR